MVKVFVSADYKLERGMQAIAVEVELPVMPRVGEYIIFDEDVYDKMKAKAIQLFEERNRVPFREYLYGKSRQMLDVSEDNAKFITLEQYIKDLDFSEATLVEEIDHDMREDRYGIYIFLRKP